MRIFSPSIYDRNAPAWLLLLLAADLMLLPMAYYALRGEFSQTLFMEIPLLFVAMTLAPINARAYRQVWKWNVSNQPSGFKCLAYPGAPVYTGG